MPHVELLPLLLEQKLVKIIPLKPLESPYSRSYDPNAKCDYHGRAVGHATERCWSLKHKIQDLLDGGVEINAISHENRDKAKGASRREREEDAVRCTTDSASGMKEETHSSRLNEVEFASVPYIEGNDNPRPKPLIIHYNLASKPRVPFIIQVSAKPVYNNNAIPWRY
ncbi:hypothetical protein CR513_46570, partial [Mucuna pruriens]